MTKPAKLCALLLQSTNRSVDFRDFIALVEAFGFLQARTKGSHRSFAHPTCPKLLVLQPKGKDAKRYQVREFLDIVEGVRSNAGRMMQHRYHINVFWYADDACWIADVPDLKPCSAHGSTPEEAIAEAQIAVEIWLETAKERGLPIPDPRYRPAIYAAA